MINTEKPNEWGGSEWLITELRNCTLIWLHRDKDFLVIMSVIQIVTVQAQKEDFAPRLISARRVVQAQCLAQPGPIPTLPASQSAPAAQQATTAQEWPTSSPSFLVPLDSTVLMVLKK